MPQLPEDIIDRLNQMERRLKALSTAVNTRPAVNEFRPTPSESVTITRPLFRIFDGYNHEIFADDILTGGLARPWLQLMPPLASDPAKWPSTTAAAFTTIARCSNPIWQPKLRLAISTAASSGATGKVRVLVDSVPFGPAVTAGTTYDYLGLLPGDMKTRFGQTMNIEIQAQATGGTVYAQPVLIHGAQT
ncbi:MULTISPECIES: hypothetical protein [Streptomyces]|uniref:Uncharacterized protein n=1 Tax=Streptomyces venezuelae (strain ATCC 10712 / CBS 650.69 / DSM 40230 / JCM 4526 / NBRC 13096 / PD 04745) TaxID=953739 RepID=F2RIT1_STRVP|nr:hypothetical protein [Streptomyces venezuelae]APE23331.1 hypothetical protein vnz_21500 [Streptomyces venezuelae]QES00709.1 hypothetical protein DEJ43_21815 [Streptomyces venezuelae ATCC 10712]QES07798.1 hypothetical protein DEJ44_20780 [Streptomyces venezuelae]QES13534.1 hypothetical protein DEJ45_14660 [Streptomyces venezuelae]CCA57637.1 hypothetical protein SVEN_4351 [Streptomyces venezuelae ATCC 10712]